MKVALVNPPRSPHNGILEHAPPQAEPFIHKKLVGPPLGLLTLAAALPDHDVSLLEMKGEYDLHPDSPSPAGMVRDFVEETRPDIAGVTFIASELPAGLEVLNAVKSVSPEIATFAGGLHATLCPEDFAGTSADVVVRGQGAHLFREAVEALEGGAPLEGVPGLLLQKDGRLRSTGAPRRRYDPASADFFMPDRSLVEPWKSTYTVGRGIGPGTYLFSSLGCTHRCSFCSIWPQYEGRYMKREIESIIDELKSCEGYPVVRFADASSVVDHGFMHRLFDRIIEERIRKLYVMDIRVDEAVADPPLIEKMSRAGLKVVISGFESFRDEELAAYNKSSRADLIREAVDIFHANGIMIRGNYVVPPDYGVEDFEALAEYAGSHKVAYAGYTVLTPLPGTPFHAEVEAEIVDRDLAKYNLFNAVLPTKLPLDEFYRRVASLWLIREGVDVI